jgi:hypothetical protein
MKLAPIVIFTYKRLDHLKKVIESIINAKFGLDSEIIFVSDGYKTNADKADVERVRNYIDGLDCFSRKKIISYDENKGLGLVIIETLNNLFEIHESLIILEDDIVIADTALEYFNAGLESFKFSEEVFQISGFVEPIESEGLPDYFYHRFISCWGWATWKDKWFKIDTSAYSLLTKMNDSKNRVKYLNKIPFDIIKDLIYNCEYTMSTWAVKWSASIFLEDGRALIPKKSFVKNIGHDSSGENCSTTDIFSASELNKFEGFDNVLLTENEIGNKRIFDFYRNPDYSFNKNNVPAILKNAKRYILNSNYRFFYHLKNKISRLKRFESLKFMWGDFDFTIIDKVSFLKHYTFLEESSLIKSYTYNSNVIFDFIPCEGTLQKVLFNISPEFKFYVSLEGTLNKEVLLANISFCKTLFSSSKDMENLLEEEKSIGLIRIENKIESILLIERNIKKIENLIVEFNHSGVDLSLVRKVFEILDNKFVINIESYNTRDDRVFLNLHRKNTQFIISAYKK